MDDELTPQQEKAMNEIYRQIDLLRKRIEAENLQDVMSETYSSLVVICQDNDLS